MTAYNFPAFPGSKSKGPGISFRDYLFAHILPALIAVDEVHDPEYLIEKAWDLADMSMDIRNDLYYSDNDK